MGRTQIYLLVIPVVLLTACKPKVSVSVDNSTTTTTAAASSSSSSTSSSSSSASNNGCPTAALFSGGTGTQGDPYQICKLADIEMLNTKLSGADYDNFKDKYYKQTADIDFNSTKVSYLPIGLYDTPPDFNNMLTLFLSSPSTKPFIGEYDGNNKKIQNMKFDEVLNSPVFYYGFFRSLGAGAVVKNLTFENPTVHLTAGFSGVVAGYSRGSLDHVNVTGLTATFPNQGMFFGGLVGLQSSGVGISNANISGSISGNTTVTYDNNVADSLNSATDSFGGAVGLLINTDSHVTTTLSHITNSATIDVAGSAAGIVAISVGQIAFDHVTNTAAIQSHLECSGITHFAAGADILGTNGLNRPTISFAVNTGNISTLGNTGDYSKVAGIVGSGMGVIITDSHNSGNLTHAHSQTGGVAGIVKDASWAEISRCYNTGNLTYTGVKHEKDGTVVTYGGIGGIVGTANDSPHLLIEDSYSTGLLTAETDESNTAGIIADMWNVGNGSSIIIRNNYSANTFVGGHTYVGAGIGQLYVPNGELPTITFEHNYYASDITTRGAPSYSFDVDAFVTAGGTDMRGGIAGLDNTQMHDQGSFTGFNFATVWNAPTNLLYPTLR